MGHQPIDVVMRRDNALTGIVRRYDHIKSTIYGYDDFLRRQPEQFVLDDLLRSVGKGLAHLPESERGHPADLPLSDPFSDCHMGLF